jgi:hypothetical protein
VEQGYEPGRIIKRVSELVDRSAETVRYTLRDYNESKPEEAVVMYTQLLSSERKQRLLQEHREGASFEVLSERYGNSVSQIRRVISQKRFEQVAKLPLDFMPNDKFEKLRLEEVMADMPEPEPCAWPG